jgi:hypothetical protein
MDCRDMFYDPINPLPRKCRKWGFPGLDHVPQPYCLIKSRTLSPCEMASAENGNFFVRHRIRRALELLVPGQCSFYPTHYKGTSEETPWLLAVPTHQVATAKVKRSIPRCDACGEPQSAHPGTQYSEWLWNQESKYHLLKSSTWGSSESGWDRWISRDLFMSARLFHLLKKIKAKGLDEATGGNPEQPDEREAVWIEKNLKLLEANGLPFHAEGTLSNEDVKWFRSYIKKHARKVERKLDIKRVEQRLKFKLPRSYVEFVTRVGPVSFENVDEQEGFTVRVLTPDQFDTESYCAGAVDTDPESSAVNGVMFASTGHGDCFCFDVQKGKKEFPVFLFKHEYNSFEPYSENFAACIKRFAGGRDGEAIG